MSDKCSSAVPKSQRLFQRCSTPSLLTSGGNGSACVTWYSRSVKIHIYSSKPVRHSRPWGREVRGQRVKTSRPFPLERNRAPARAPTAVFLNFFRISRKGNCLRPLIYLTTGSPRAPGGRYNTNCQSGWFTSVASCSVGRPGPHLMVSIGQAAPSFFVAIGRQCKQLMFPPRPGACVRAGGDNIQNVGLKFFYTSKRGGKRTFGGRLTKQNALARECPGAGQFLC